ncbi:MAG: DUF2157 domain-containing protein [Alphaproteobacteria bacterium]|nr:DUF2157 domain-containing protein [Alphaproteobacteria bacterium]
MEQDHSLAESRAASGISLSTVWLLGQKRHIGSNQWAAAHTLVRPEAQWRSYLEHALVSLGVLHLVAGVLFFFAFNWADLAKMHKFALIFAGLFLSFGLWWRLGADSLKGQAAGLATTMMLGVLMAYFGQTYQTGADAWELFFGWAMLSLPWMLVSLSAAHVLLWSLVALVATHTYLDQVGVPFGFLDGKWVSFIAGGGMALILLVLHLPAARLHRLRTWWLAGTLQLISIGHFATATWMGAVMFGFEENHDPKIFLAGLSCLAIFLWLAIYRIGSSFAAVLSFAGIASSLTIYPIALIAKHIGDFGFLTFLMCGAVGFAGTAGFVIAVRPLMALTKRSGQ